MPEGFRSLVTFSLDRNLAIWEISNKPPGVDGGDAIDITTQHNVTWHTMAPRTLLKLEPVTITCAYDPDAYSKIITHLVNVNGQITFLYPDGSTLAFWGWLQKFEPSELKEGEFPQASVTITPSNYDDANHVEAAPVLVPHAGT